MIMYGQWEVVQAGCHICVGYLILLNDANIPIYLVTIAVLLQW